MEQTWSKYKTPFSNAYLDRLARLSSRASRDEADVILRRDGDIAEKLLRFDIPVTTLPPNSEKISVGTQGSLSLRTVLSPLGVVHEDPPGGCHDEGCPSI